MLDVFCFDSWLDRCFPDLCELVLSYSGQQLKTWICVVLIFKDHYIRRDHILWQVNAGEKKGLDADISELYMINVKSAPAVCLRSQEFAAVWDKLLLIIPLDADGWWTRSRFIPRFISTEWSLNSAWRLMPLRDFKEEKKDEYKTSRFIL